MGQAIADFTKAVELDPKATRAFNQRGIAHYRKGQWEKASADFGSAIEQKPTDPVYWSNRGDALSKLRQWEKAISDFTKSIDLNANLPTPWHLRGDAQASLDQWDKASDDLAKAGSFPNAFHQSFSKYALVRLQLKDVPGYRQTCTRLTEKWTAKDDPQFIVWVCSVAPNSGADLGPLIKALEEKITGKSANAYLDLRALGAALYRSGKSKEAIKKLEEAAAARKQPSPAAWIFLAMAQHQLEQKDDAQKSLEKARSWIAEARKNNADADPKAVSWSSFPWTERIPLELIFREAEELLKTSQ
jgi:tetratricopeptide (TPR) repeat protein